MIDSQIRAGNGRRLVENYSCGRGFAEDSSRGRRLAEHLHCGRNQIENSHFDLQKPRMPEGYSVMHSSIQNY